MDRTVFTILWSDGAPYCVGLNMDWGDNLNTSSLFPLTTLALYCIVLQSLQSYNSMKCSNEFHHIGEWLESFSSKSFDLFRSQFMHSY